MHSSRGQTAPRQRPAYLTGEGHEGRIYDVTGPELVTAAAYRDLLQEIGKRPRGFFRVRLDRLTPREKDYVRAMAALGAGSHRSGEIAHELRIDVTKAGPLRNGLIKKGVIYSPQHGDTAFTVPMFDEFMRRSIPDWTSGGTG
jgi:hypothetical protein